MPQGIGAGYMAFKKRYIAYIRRLWHEAEEGEIDNIGAIEKKFLTLL